MRERVAIKERFGRVVLVTGLITTLLLPACSKNGGEPAAEETAPAPAPEPTPTPAPPTAPDGSCAAPASWFPQSQTPEPDPNAPFENFCDFHKWAWQSFLWLTQTDPSTGRLRFETFPTVGDVIRGSRSATPMPKLAPRVRKNVDPKGAIDEINQAGPGGILVDHDGHVVYYSQYVNPQMFDEIVNKKWNDPATLSTLPPDTEFSTGDVELKAAWKIVAPGEDTSKLFTTKAIVDKLVDKGGTIVADRDAPEEVTVALVGLHVVGWVEGHPEAIWATFEQVDNAPDFAHGQSPRNPVSDRDWTFYTAGTTALDVNQLNAATLSLDEAAQAVTPITQVARQYPFGMVPDPTDPDDQQNLEAINTLNESVWEQLAPDNVWKNYFEVGAIWTNGDLKPNETLQDALIGSTLLSNATIETFTQAIRSENNCFSCHNTLMFNPTDPSVTPLQGTNLNVSHIILEAYLANQPESN